MGRKHLFFLNSALLGVGLIACGHEIKQKEETQFTRLVLQEKTREMSDPQNSEGKKLGNSIANEIGLDSSNKPGDPEDRKTAIKFVSEEDILAKIGTGQEQNQLVCKHHLATRPNAVIKAFCVDKIKPRHIYELQQALGLAIVNESYVTREQNGTDGNPAFALLGHSTSLVGRLVSGPNPRAILFTPPGKLTATNLDFVMMSFVRGEQLIELAAFDGQSKSLEFYLLNFKQACNEKEGGCSPGDLVTPEIEKNWTETTIYAMDQLADTILDCTHCHQPLGPTAPRSLRMQELQTPWSHWFSNDTQGLALINDYYATRGKTEIYAGIPGPMIGASRPELLDIFIKKTGLTSAQINDFKSLEIETQIVANNPKQPVDNTLPGISSIWQSQYEQSKKSLLPPIPYHDIKVTEYGQASRAINEYQAFRQGLKTASELSGFKDIFKTDQNLRAKMGFAIEKEAGAQEILERACGQCHNNRLDQNLLKSRFNVMIDQIKDRDKVLETAIQRVQLGYSPERLNELKIHFVQTIEPTDSRKTQKNGSAKNDPDLETEDEGTFIPPRYSHALTMPPGRFRQLTDEQIDVLVLYFESKKSKK